MDYFDLAAEHGGVAGRGLRRHAARASASSPSPPTGSTRRRRAASVVRALNAAAANVSFVEIETDKGHDAFLLDEPELFATLRGFLDRLRRASRPDRAEAADEPQRRASSRREPARRPRVAAPTELRRDLRLIADMIEPGARVLDIGCGDGALLGLSGAREGRRRPRHRDQPVRRQCLRRPRPGGDPGRRRQRPRRLSRQAPSTTSC